MMCFIALHIYTCLHILLQTVKSEYKSISMVFAQRSVQYIDLCVLWCVVVCVCVCVCVCMCVCACLNFLGSRNRMP